jgi:hypothetical protein
MLQMSGYRGTGRESMPMPGIYTATLGLKEPHPTP